MCAHAEMRHFVQHVCLGIVSAPGARVLRAKVSCPPPGPRPTANQPRVADRVVRRAKRPVVNERRIGRQQAGHAVDFGDFEGFIDAGFYEAWRGRMPGRDLAMRVFPAPGWPDMRTL